MAYDLSQRFSSGPAYYRILDPGAYQKVTRPKTQINKVPFLSRTPRCTQPGGRLWTHAIYYTNLPPHISNCTAFKSKRPRFPYEALTEEDVEKLLCQCGILNSCDCPTSEHEEEEISCQGKVRRRLFKGPPPRIIDSSKEIKTIISHIEPPFYNTRVVESTSFYQGCKWSHWTSKRSVDYGILGPGPADYQVNKEPRAEDICAEKVRSYKRKTSKQPRYIESVQQRNIKEGLPGPGSYDPKILKGTELSYLGPRAERFSTLKYDIRPGPTDYCLKRDFDKPRFPEKLCQAKLTEPAPFGYKDIRSKPMYEQGPSPATYNPKGATCKFMQCSTAPFGASCLRFKEIIDGNDEDDDNIDDDNIPAQSEPIDREMCLLPTWEFRSQTVRMKKLYKNFKEPSPADLPQPNVKISRSIQLQSAAPFFTSDERFRPWYNWIPVHGVQNTPGPCYYCLEKPKCLPAVRRGPLVRSLRFKSNKTDAPSPNRYKIGGGIESVLATHNQRLKSTMEKMHKFTWKPLKHSGKLSPEQKEDLLFRQSIALLNENDI